MSFNFVTAVTICGYLEAKKIKSVTVSLFPHLFAMGLDVMGPGLDGTGCHDLRVLNVEF